MPADTEQRTTSQQRKKAPLAAAVVMLCVLVAFAVILVAGLGRKKADESQLSKSRQLLQEVVDDSTDDESLQSSREAARLLGEYIEQGGDEIDTAKLLLAAATANEFILDERAPLSHDKRMQQLIVDANLAKCDTGDLLLAEELFTSALRMRLADKVIDELLKRRQQRVDTLRRAIKVRQHVGRNREALASCDELIAIRPEELLPWKYKTMVLEEFGFDEALIEPYAKVLELSPESAAEIQPKRVHSLIAVGRTTDAREEFDRFQRNFPNTAKRNELLAAQMRLLDGEASELERIVSQRLAEDPHNIASLLLLTQVVLSRGQSDEMSEVVQRLEPRAIDNPKNIALRQATAALYERLGDAEMAKKWRESAEQLKQSLAR